MLRPQSKDSTNENNTDVDRWTDARRLRIDGKRCSKPWRYLNLPDRRAGSRQHYCGGHDMRLPLTTEIWGLIGVSLFSRPPLFQFWRRSSSIFGGDDSNSARL